MTLKELRVAEDNADIKVAAAFEKFDRDVLQALCDTQKLTIGTLEQEVSKLEKLVYQPGLARCPKCKFFIVVTNFYVRDGSLGAGDARLELCPNDGTQMERVTYKSQVDELAVRLADMQIEMRKLKEDYQEACAIVRDRD